MRVAAPRWLLPAARCPNCGAVPAFRITPRERDRAAGEDPGTVKCSVKCQISWCRQTYPLTAGDFAGAS